MKRDRAVAAEVSLIGVAAVWGLTFVMVQDAIAILPVMAFLAYRFCAAGLVLAIVFRRNLRSLDRRGWRGGLIMGGWLTAGYIFQTLGLERTTAAHAGFITGMFVVLTPIFGALFFKQRVGRLSWIAAAVSAVGLLLLSGGDGDVRILGDGLVFLCACTFAGHILATGRAVEDHAPGALAAIQLGTCGLVSLVIAVGGGQLEVPRSAVVWNALLITAFVASALGFFLQTYAQRHASPARTALILASEPAFAGLFAYLLNDEVLGLTGWLGAALILAAIVTVEAVPYARRARLPEGPSVPETRSL
jgi:drug/metabolite transporter (DMT)-like permease